MRYEHVRAGRFLARPNRFIAQVELEDSAVTCHVKNTGRCRELLLPGARVYLQDFGAVHDGRKTRYDLIAVEKERPGQPPLLVNMDAQAPNKVFAQWAQAGGFVRDLTLLRPETAWGGSRFDFYYETACGVRGFVEVKGVTLEEGGLAAFPDAPTQRGVKHLDELARAAGEGYAAHVCFVVQMEGMTLFCPNERTHPAFGAVMRRAAKAGVELLARGCTVAADSLEIACEIPLFLSGRENFAEQR